MWIFDSLSVKRKNIRRFIIRWKYGSKQAGNDHCPVGTGHAGRCDPSGPDSDFKDDAGSIVRAVFQRDILLQNEITYAQALQEVVGILMYGIASER